MLARGEANPAVSINEPSLEAALISGCMGAVLFTIPPSLTLLIPNGFERQKQEYSEPVVYREATFTSWKELFLELSTLCLESKSVDLNRHKGLQVSLKKQQCVYYLAPMMKSVFIL